MTVVAQNRSAATARQGGKTDAARRDEAEQMLVLKRDGWSEYDIAKKFKVSETTVHRRISYALSFRTAVNADELRKMSTVRLEEQYKGLQAIINANGSPTSKVMAHAAQRNIEETLAKLWGYNAPVKVDATITFIGGVDEELQALAGELGLGDNVIEGEIVSDSDSVYGE